MVKAIKKGKHDAVYYLQKWKPKARRRIDVYVTCLVDAFGLLQLSDVRSVQPVTQVRAYSTVAVSVGITQRRCVLTLTGKYC